MNRLLILLLLYLHRKEETKRKMRKHDAYTYFCSFFVYILRISIGDAFFFCYAVCMQFQFQHQIDQVDRYFHKEGSMIRGAGRGAGVRRCYSPEPKEKGPRMSVGLCIRWSFFLLFFTIYYQYYYYYLCYIVCYVKRKRERLAID